VKRDPRLRGLSSDHHHALRLARRVLEITGDAEEPAITALWRDARHAYTLELDRHFAVEERTLLPAMRAAGHGDLVDRTLDDHRRMRAMLDAAVPDVDALRKFGTLLRDHVRFEEGQLFETAQTALSDEALDTVAADYQSPDD
jgi:hemerythrin-like domain-containing protein